MARGLETFFMKAGKGKNALRARAGNRQGACSSDTDMLGRCRLFGHVSLLRSLPASLCMKLYLCRKHPCLFLHVAYIVSSLASGSAPLFFTSVPVR